MPSERASRSSSPALEEVTISKLVAGGDGLGRLSDGRVVFVPGTAPADVVQVELTSSKRDLARGVVVEVLTPSPDRVAPPCSRVAAGCGGCDWQHLTGVAQHAAKTSVAADAFNRIGRLPEQSARIRFGGSVAADGRAWRTTVRSAVNRQGRAGFYRSGSHEVVASGPCMVAHPVIADVLDRGNFGGAGEVTVRVGVHSKRLVVGSTHPKDVRLPAVPAGWAASVVGLPAAGGVGAVTELVHGIELRVSIGSFFQSGPAAAELLSSTVEALLAPFDAPDAFVDLYGGVGLLAATAGRRARHRVVVESANASVDDARVNLGPDAVVHRSLVEEWDPPRAVRRAANVHVVADPSRAGLGHEGVEAVTRCKPSALVLVSCDAPAGARDAHLLTEAGFVLRDAVVLDLFPHTSHLETVSLFVPADQAL